MKAVRHPAIVFAIFSALYWLLVSDLVRAGSPLGGFRHQPYWEVVVAGVLPGALYALLTLYFCHWLVRRALRQNARKEKD